jgi:hypothetical protein
VFHHCRAGGLLSARYDQRLDWKTSRGQNYFVLSSCVPWNLIGEAVRRLQREEAAARDAAALARRAGDQATARGEDSTVHFESELGAISAADRWANLKAELTHEVRTLPDAHTTSKRTDVVLSDRLPGPCCCAVI